MTMMRLCWLSWIHVKIVCWKCLWSAWERKRWFWNNLEINPWSYSKLSVQNSQSRTVRNRLLDCPQAYFWSANRFCAALVSSKKNQRRTVRHWSSDCPLYNLKSTSRTCTESWVRWNINGGLSASHRGLSARRVFTQVGPDGKEQNLIPLRLKSTAVPILPSLSLWRTKEEEGWWPRDWRHPRTVREVPRTLRDLLHHVLPVNQGFPFSLDGFGGWKDFRVDVRSVIWAMDLMNSLGVVVSHIEEMLCLKFCWISLDKCWDFWIRWTALFLSRVNSNRGLSAPSTADCLRMLFQRSSGSNG